MSNGLPYQGSMSINAQDLTDTKLAALDRLTEREKDCLRRWLLHKTAKEIAIDLGVSPHAVEKRLKMARAKLGVSTSLEAARLLSANEGYDPTVPHRPDLDDTTSQSKNWATRSSVLGAIIMSILAIALVAAVAQLKDPVREIPRTPKPGEILIAGPISFEALDTNGSGYLDGKEAPKLVLFGGNATYERKVEGSVNLSGNYVEVYEGGQLRDTFYVEADTDRDGLVSPDEFKRWATIHSN